MMKKIAAFFERRRLHRQAASVALAAFDSPEAQADAQAYVVWSDETRFIVQIAYGYTRPPRRAWFSVTRDCTSATPMTREQVNAVYPVPVWR